MLPKEKLIDQRLDYAIIFPVFCLLIFGLVSVYVAASHDFPQSLATVMLQQVLWILLGAVIAFTPNVF
nr:hypothetical protein [Streptococcus equi]